MLCKARDKGIVSFSALLGRPETTVGCVPGERQKRGALIGVIAASEEVT